MTFPLYYLLIAYFIFLAVWLVMSAVALFHMFRFGFRTAVTKMTIVIYLLVSVAIIAVTATFITQVDWNYPVTLFSEAFDGA